MRKLIVLAVLFLGVMFVILRFTEVENLLGTLQRANPWYLALALVIQTAWFFVLGWTFKSIYVLLGLNESLRRLTLIAAAGSFVNIVTSSAGAGGLAIFISEGRTHSLPPGKVTVASALYLLLDEAAFLCVLALGMVVLIRHNHLGAGEIMAALILLAIATVLASLFYIGYRSTEALGNALAKLARLTNRIAWPFIHREYLSEARAHSFASEILRRAERPARKAAQPVPAFSAFAGDQGTTDGNIDLQLSIVCRTVYGRHHRGWVRHRLSVPDRVSHPVRHRHRGGRHGDNPRIVGS